jgi:hypothetical protein
MRSETTDELQRLYTIQVYPRSFLLLLIFYKFFIPLFPLLAYMYLFLFCLGEVPEDLVAALIPRGGTRYNSDPNHYIFVTLRSEKVVGELLQLCTKLFENLFRSDGVAIYDRSHGTTLSGLTG